MIIIKDQKEYKIKELCKIIGGDPAPKGNDVYSDKGTPFLKMKDLGKYHLTNNLIEIENKVSDEIAKKNNLKIVNKGCILLPRSGSVALNHRAILGVDSYMVSHICALEVIDKKILFNQFLYYYLRRISMEKITKRTTGLDAITFKDLGNIKITLPSIDDQIRIATVLSHAEALIAKRKESIRLLDELIKSTFLEMFGSVNNFKHVEINDIAEKERYALSSGPFGSNLTSKHYTNKGVIVLRGTNITSCRLNLDDVKYISEEKALELKRSEVKPDDIVIVAVGASGQALKIPRCLEKAIMSQNFNKITPDKTKVNPTFLEFIINNNFVQNQFKKQITNTVRTFLSLTKIKKVKIPFPPLPLQNKFSQIVEKVESIKSKYEVSLTELENLYGSLSQRAFRGELDLSRVPTSIAIKPETVEVELESHESEVKTTKKFFEKELLKIIKLKSGQSFNFDELWNRLEAISFEERPQYDDVKKMIFNMLEGDKPLLSQSFDKERKEIVLRVNV